VIDGSQNERQEDQETISDAETQPTAAQELATTFLESDPENIKTDIDALLSSDAFSQLDEMQLMQIINKIATHDKPEGILKFTTALLNTAVTHFIPPNVITSLVINLVENPDKIKELMGRLPLHEKALLLTTTNFPEELKPQIVTELLNSISNDSIHPLTLRIALPYLAEHNGGKELKENLSANMKNMKPDTLKALIESSPTSLQDFIKENLDDDMKKKLVESYFVGGDPYQMEGNSLHFTKGEMKRSFKLSKAFMDDFVDQVIGAAFDGKPVDKVVTLAPLNYLMSIYDGFNEEDGSLSNPNSEKITWKFNEDETFVASNKAIVDEANAIKTEMEAAQAEAQSTEVDAGDTGGEGGAVDTGAADTGGEGDTGAVEVPLSELAGAETAPNENHPSWELYINAEIKFREGNYEDAISEADITIQSYEGHMDAYYIKGRALMELERYDEALKVLKTIKANLSPNTWNVEPKNIDEQITHCESALTTTPGAGAGAEVEEGETSDEGADVDTGAVDTGAVDTGVADTGGEGGDVDTGAADTSPEQQKIELGNKIHALLEKNPPPNAEISIVEDPTETEKMITLVELNVGQDNQYDCYIRNNENTIFITFGEKTAEIEVTDQNDKVLNAQIFVAIRDLINEATTGVAEGDDAATGEGADTGGEGGGVDDAGEPEDEGTGTAEGDEAALTGTPDTAADTGTVDTATAGEGGYEAPATGGTEAIPDATEGEAATAETEAGQERLNQITAERKKGLKAIEDALLKVNEAMGETFTLDTKTIIDSKGELNSDGTGETSCHFAIKNAEGAKVARINYKANFKDGAEFRITRKKVNINDTDSIAHLIQTRAIIDKREISKDDANGLLEEYGVSVTNLSEGTTLNNTQIHSLQYNAERIENAMKTALSADDVLRAIQAAETDLLGVNNFGSEFQKFTQFELNLGGGVTINWNDFKTTGFNSTDFIGKIRIMEKVLEVKKATDPKGYEGFAARTETARIDLSDSWEVEAQHHRVSKQIKALIDGDRPDYDAHPSIANWDENEITSNWEKLQGNARVESLMKQSPFGIRTADVPAKAGNVISTLVGENYFDFDHVYEAMFNENADVILEEMEDLQEKMNEERMSVSELEAAVAKMDQHFDKVQQTILLAESLRDLRFVEDDTEAQEHSPEQKEANEANEKIEAQLSQLFNFSELEDSGVWDDFLHLVSGSGDASELTMNREGADADYAYEGYLKANYSPESALALMANDRRNGLYTIENGVTKLDPVAVTKQVNRMIKLGYLQTQMIAGKTAEAGEGIDLGQAPLITDINSASFTSEQMQFFQLGFIASQLTDAEKNITEAETDIEAAIEAAKNDPANPAISHVLTELSAQNPEVDQYLPQIKEKMLAAGGLMITVENGEPRVSGAGIGTSFDLGNGVSFQIGGAITEDGGDLGIGLTFKIYDGENLDISYSEGISLAGFGVAVSAELSDPETLGKINATFGAGMSWAGIPVIGGSLSIDINRQAMLKVHLDEATEGMDDYKAAWETWKGLRTSQEKYDALDQQAPRIKELADHLVTTYDLEPGDVVHVIEQMDDVIRAQAFEDFDYPIGVPSGFGVAVVNGIPIPFIKFSLGSVTAFVPHRKALKEIQAEQAVVEQGMEIRIQNALKDYEANRYHTVALFEGAKNGDLIYDQNGEMMALADESSVDFSQIPTTSIDDYNEALAPAEVSLKPLENGKTELIIHNLDRGKDTEMYIDPALKALGVIKDGNRIIIDGNINNLIIDRKRYKLPFKQNEANASIRDIITIRQKSSVQGGRDTKWMMDRGKGKMVRWSDSETMEGFDPPPHMMNVDNFGEQNNMMEINGYAGMTDQESIIMRPHDVDANVMKSIHASREELPQGFDPEMQADFEGIFEDYDARVANGDKLTEAAYDAESLPDNFYGELRTLINNEDIRKELNKDPDNAPNIARNIIMENFPDASARAVNEGITFILTEYFTNILDKGDKIGEVIADRIEDVFMVSMKPLFESTLSKIPEEIRTASGFTTGEEVARYILDTTYGDLLTKLKSGEVNYAELEELPIPQGALFKSASRYYEDGIQDREHRKYSVEGAIFHSENIPSAEEMGMEHGVGFIAETMKNYSLTTEDPKDKAIAYALMENCSPIPEEGEHAEFLKCPLALKMISNKPLLFITGLKIGTEELKMVQQAIDNPDAINDNVDWQVAIGKYRNFVLEVRNMQETGTTMKIPAGPITIEIGTQTEIATGAYTKCANASWYIDEGITASAYYSYEDTMVMGEFSEHQETIDSEITKKFVDLALGAGIVVEDTPPPPGKRPDR
ncbi:tol-pal system YbgF family protein, partial [Patescibacteria group bacterium]